ncbi:hypothetical protein, partial [Escherichia coli]
MSVEDPQSSHLGNMESIICCSLSLSLLSLVIERRKNHVDMGIIYKMIGFAPIFPDTCYHLTHYWPAAADIPVASDNPVH